MPCKIHTQEKFQIKNSYCRPPVFQLLLRFTASTLTASVKKHLLQIDSVWLQAKYPGRRYRTEISDVEVILQGRAFKCFSVFSPPASPPHGGEMSTAQQLSSCGGITWAKGQIPSQLLTHFSSWVDSGKQQDEKVTAGRLLTSYHQWKTGSTSEKIIKCIAYLKRFG